LAVLIVNQLTRYKPLFLTSFYNSKKQIHKWQSYIVALFSMPPKKRGRKENFIWVNFERKNFSTSKKRWSCTCKHCDLEVKDGRVAFLI
jgi:hypothetical protein